jgi:hypothetical protein
VVEQMRMSFARTLLGLKSSTPVWNVIRELGWYPLQIYVAQQLVRFMNRLWGMPDNTIARRALLEMWHDYLLDECNDNWCARVHIFLQAAGIAPEGSLPGVALDIPVYDERNVVAALRAACHKVYLSPGLPPKLAAYIQLQLHAFPLPKVVSYSWATPSSHWVRIKTRLQREVP